MQNIFKMNYPYETPKPTTALVIILITALASVTIVGVSFFQSNVDSVHDKYNSVYGIDSIKLVKEQLKLLKRKVRNTTQYDNELEAGLVDKNNLSTKKTRTIKQLKEREIKLKYRYNSAIVRLKKRIRALELRIKSQKTILDSCLTTKELIR